MSLHRSIVLVSGSLALAGCVSGPLPEIATPSPELPRAFLYEPGADAEVALASLLPVSDPAFAALAQQALRQAPSLAEALARVELARASARSAGAALLPVVGADASVSATRTNPAQFGDGLPGAIVFDSSRTAFAGNLTATWEADIFGRLRANERAALARLDAATASAAAVRTALISEIAGNVIDWRSLAARQIALSKDLEAATRLAQLARAREEAGLAPGFDRARAEAAASQSRSRIAVLASERARILGRLTALTAIPSGEISQMLKEHETDPELPGAPSSLPSQLLQNRPDIRAAEAELTAADADLAVAARQQFPRLTLSAALGVLAFDLAGLFDEESEVYSLTGGIAAPLFDFGRIQSQIDGAAAGKQAAFATYRSAVYNALGEAETAYGLVSAADAEADAIRRESADLEYAASLAETRYRAGLADFLTVLEARRAADSSGERAAAAIGTAQRARTLLWQALGGDSQAIMRSTSQ